MKKTLSRTIVICWAASFASMSMADSIYDDVINEDSFINFEHTEDELAGSCIARHEKQRNYVMSNDIGFSVHASWAQAITDCAEFAVRRGYKICECSVTCSPFTPPTNWLQVIHDLSSTARDNYLSCSGEEEDIEGEDEEDSWWPF